MPVTSKHPDYQDRIPDWEDCRMFYEGERTVKSMGVRFLPRPASATSEEYSAYIKRAFFFGGVERTVAGLSGSIDRKAPAANIPKQMEYLDSNADGNDSSLRQFSKAVLDEVILMGRAGIMIERPAEENGDPYFVLYKAEHIINWRTNEQGELVLVVLVEYFDEQIPGDEFSIRRTKQYRVLRLDEAGYYEQIVFRGEIPVQGLPRRSKGEKKPDPKEYIPFGPAIQPLKQGQRLDRIPFVICNVRGLGAEVEKPPLLDLVRKNAEHFRVSADYANALYFTGNPILYTKGVSTGTPRPHSEGYDGGPQVRISIGSSRAVNLPKTDQEIGLLECRGHGVNPNRDKANDALQEMAVLGARLLEGQRKGVETAETALLNKTGETSVLSNIVTNVSNAMRKAIEIIAQWENISPEGIEYQLNDDFVDITINSQLLAALKELVINNLMSWRTFFFNLAKGELTPPGVTHEEEYAEIMKGLPMGQPMQSDNTGLEEDDETPPEDQNGDENKKPPQPGKIQEQDQVQ